MYGLISVFNCLNLDGRVLSLSIRLLKFWCNNEFREEEAACTASCRHTVCFWGELRVPYHAFTAVEAPLRHIAVLCGASETALMASAGWREAASAEEGMAGPGGMTRAFRKEEEEKECAQGRGVRRPGRGGEWMPLHAGQFGKLGVGPA